MMNNAQLELYAENNRYDMLSKFQSVEEFNNHFEQSMLLHKDKFTKGEYIALNKLRKFAYSDKSLDTIGVAWARAQKIVAATHKDFIFGVSRSTFDRMLRKAKRLNLITVINTFDEHNYKKHNVYVFNHLEELTPEKFEIVKIVSETDTIEESHDEKIDESITIILELPKLKDIKTYQQAEKVADKENEPINFETSKTEYQQVAEMINGLFAEKKITYRMYGAWLCQIKKMKNKPSFDLCKRAIYVLIGEIKRRITNDLRPLTNPVGYFHGVLSNMIDQQFEQQQVELWENDLFVPKAIESISVFNPHEELSRYFNE